jgi:hypothetical protein
VETLGQAMVVAFYGAMVLALAYFVHKVAWFVRMRRLQDELVQQAERRVREAIGEALHHWDEAAHGTWERASTRMTDEDPVAYVRRMEARLGAMERVLAERGARTSAGMLEAIAESEAPARSAQDSGLDHAVRERTDTIRTWFLQNLRASFAGERSDSSTVLSMPRVSSDPVDVVLSVTFPEPHLAAPPPEELYVVEVRSRYGLLRRALAFVLGAADVVYSASHVARMSQNAQVPVGVIVRRLSLVVLILGAIVIDIVFTLRARLITIVEARLGPGPHLARWLGDFGATLDEHLAAGIALGGWLAAYGAIYFGLYLFLRRRSQAYLRQLAAMHAQREEDLTVIRQRHLDKLTAWADGYAATLDDAVSITARQARLLLRRTARRLRRRLASDELATIAERIAVRLFAELPESSAGLVDVATGHEHSWRHAIWPRVEELGYQVELARKRAAWRRIEAGLAAMRAERPDPGEVHGLWRTLAAVLPMFPTLFDDADLAELEKAYRASAEVMVRGTEADFEELDRRLADLATSLHEQLGVAGALLETRVELAEQAMEAEVAALAARLLEIRERARLEAMAFEI